jgi:general secretion pathway protein D
MAQTPGTNDGDAANTALRDEILRRAVRGESIDSNAAAAPAAAPSTPATVAAAPEASAGAASNAPAAAATTALPPGATPAPTAAGVVIPAPTVVIPTPTIPAPTTSTAAAPAASAVGAGQPGVPPGRRFRPGGVPPIPGFGQPPGGVTGGFASTPAPNSVGMRSARSDEEATNVIEFPSIDINTFLDVYASEVGRTVLRSPTIGNPNITLQTQRPLTKTELIEAMDTVLAMNGITMMNVGSNFVKAVPMAEAGANAAPFREAGEKAEGLGNLDQYVSQIVQLKYAKPSEVVPVITPLAKIPGNIFPIDSSQILIIRDYAGNVKRMLELIAQVDVIVPMDFQSEVIPIRYAKAADIAAALGSLGAGTGTGIPGGSSSGGAGGSSSRLGGGGGFGGGAGGYSPGGGAQGTLGGLNSTGGLGAPGGAPRTASFSDRLRGAVNSLGGGAGDIKILGQTKIIPDERTNSLLIFADKQDMQTIKDVINKLDVVLAQVLIDAIIMEVTLDNSRDLAISYNQVTPSSPGNYFQGIGAINNGTFLSPNNFVGTGSNALSGLPSGLSYLANFGQDFDATITAVANDSRVKVLSRPRIQTSHAVKAELQVGNTVPYVTGTYFGGINGQASSQYQQTFIGLDLQVTPLINADGMVVMDINLNVQQLGPSTTIDGNSVPTTTQRSATATVSVKDRETIILGGFISDNVSSSHGGVPLLMDLPVLGYLFRSSNDTKERVELVALIRPTYLPTPESAALFAAQQRDKMPAIKAAERDWRADENAREKEASKIKVPDELP